MYTREELSRRRAHLTPQQRERFEHQLREAAAPAEPRRDVILRRPAGAAVPLSFIQERMWSLQQRDPTRVAFNEHSAMLIDGDLNVAALNQAAHELHRRHEVLRASFRFVDRQLRQIIEPAARVRPRLPLIDLMHLPADAREAAGHRLALAESLKPFDLRHGPLLRLTLLRLDARAHVLLRTMHHIIYDGWSNEVFISELIALYRACEHDAPSPLPELPVQYGDFACWQREWLQGSGVEDQESGVGGQGDKACPEWERGETRRQGDKETGRQDPSLRLSPQSHALSASEGSVLSPQSSAVSPLQAQLAYWRAQLAAPLPALQLPADRPHLATRQSCAACVKLPISAGLTAALKQVGQPVGATLFMVLLAAFKVLLAAYSGQTDLIVGTHIAGRNRPEIERLIGCFINLLPLRTNLAGDPTFMDLLWQVRSVTLGGYSHQDVPFERLAELFQPRGSPNRDPIYHAMFVLQNVPKPNAHIREGLEIRSWGDIGEQWGAYAQCDTSLVVQEQADGGLLGALAYDAALFDATTMRRMIEQYHTLLEQISADSRRRISALTLELNDGAPDQPATRPAHTPRLERRSGIPTTETCQVVERTSTAFQSHQPPPPDRFEAPIDESDQYLTGALDIQSDTMKPTDPPASLFLSAAQPTLLGAIANDLRGAEEPTA